MKFIFEISQKIHGTENRLEFLEPLNLKPEQLIRAKLVHGTHIETVSQLDIGKTFSASDGLITADPGTFLAVTVSDCLPIAIFDQEKGIAAILHAGWRGLVSGIIDQALNKFFELGSQPKNLQAIIGPGISVCHFEVQDDFLTKLPLEFAEQVLGRRQNKKFVDLKKLAELQFQKRGVDQIKIDPDCTYCQDQKYFSYRRDKPGKVQPMLAIVGMV